MLKISFLILIAGLVLILIGLIKTKPWKNNEQKSWSDQNETSEIDSYALYLGMCKRDNEEPIGKDLFQTLANEDGKISLFDLMEVHCKINAKLNRKFIDDEITTKEELSIETNQEKNKNEKFVNSAIAGYATNSAALGTIIGGSLFGAVVGDKLQKKGRVLNDHT
jgi:hypothetical protein